MTQNEVEVPPKRPNNSGVRAALKYTGIPPSWIDKRPKLPSRNWLIFLSTTSSILGLYFYDRRRCKQIKQSYVDRVKVLAEEPLNPLDAPRKVVVYGAKWPGDEDYDQSIKYFRKYVKPIFVAAAVDYEMVTGKRHGEIFHRVAGEIQLRRRADAGLELVSEITKVLPTYKSPEEARRRELDGGIVIVGRHTLKEYLAGLHKGWTSGLRKVDEEEMLAQELGADGRFDEPEEPEEGMSDSPNPVSKQFQPPHPVFSPLQFNPPQTPQRPGPPSTETSLDVPPPSQIPPLPPLLLVPFTNYIGFTQIPLMIWDFFNQRHKVRSGAEAAYDLVMGNSRPIITPSDTGSDAMDSVPKANHGDLDFDKKAESYYKTSLSKIPTDIKKARTKYYEALPAKLETARALARGTREPTKEENENPPPTEVELRAERLKKELRWRNDLEGWDIVKPSQEATWDDRFRDAIRLFTKPVGETELVDPESI